ncbi:MAG: aspartate aminotransferase family protein [Myxococcota bacterium]|jgi:glutamate-1-semialdehyde 2,1-aminomutase|nr:aspartate aminotransferase family protein [Myxococcota bacterium]
MTNFERIPRSAQEQELLDRAAHILPASARTPTMSLDSAIIVKEGRGSKLRDLSGNEYIDYLLGSGPMFVGHCHPAVVAAAHEAIDHGSSYLLPNEAAVLLADAIVKETPCAERVAYGSTGSDAAFFALRLARAYRKRDKILKFEGGYHGQTDHAMMSNQWTKQPADYPTPVPNSEGIPAATAGDVLVAPYNDIDRAASLIEANADDLGAVIVEPMQRTVTPREGFLEGLREVTRRLDIPLVFDEVVTGFRFGLGSAQGYYGVTPDLTAMGKSLSAGHPLSVVCGNDELMQYGAGVRRLTGDYVAMTGTFSGNAVSCAVGLAVIKELQKEGVYEALFARGRRLSEAVASACEKNDIPCQIAGEPPAFEPWFTDQPVVDYRSSMTADPKLTYGFAQALFNRGILKAHEKFFISIVHSDEDIDVTIDAMGEAAEEIAANR